jgi:phage gp29-like protein
LIRSTNDWIYDYALSSAYRAAYVYDPDFALSRDADIWEKVRRDAVILSSIERRERALVREWRVEPPRNSKKKSDKMAASVVEDAISRIHRFNEARRRLTRGSILGRAYEYIQGERVICSLAGLPEMEWWIPTRFQHVDRRRFHWVPDRGLDENGEPTLNTHLSMFSITRQKWVDLSPEERNCFVEYVYDDTEDRVGYGRGKLEAIYFYHFMKTAALEKVAQGIDRWANGIVIGKLDSLRNASTSKTNEDLKTGMKNLLKNMRSEHIAVLQDGDEIQVVETSGTGHEITMNFVRYLDESIERMLNGSILPFGHFQSVGSRARADVEYDVSEQFYQDDRDDLDEILTRDLVGQFWRLNRLNFCRLGMADAQMPKFRTEQQKREDPVMATDVATRLLQAGIPIVKSELYHKTGFSIPEEGEEVIEGRPMFDLNPSGENGDFRNPDRDRDPNPAQDQRRESKNPLASE